MKSREQGGVVDSRLNVYGVDGLKIAGTLHSGSYCFTQPSRGHGTDMSIVPGNVAAVSGSRYTDQNTVDLNAKNGRTLTRPQ